MEFTSNQYTAIGAGGLLGLASSITGNNAVAANNKSIDAAIKELRARAAELAKERKQIISTGSNAANNFLLSYMTIKDPNKAQGLTSVYSQNVNNTSNLMRSNSSEQSAVSSSIAQLKAQKQHEKEWWETGLDMLGGAASTLPLLLI